MRGVNWRSELFRSDFDREQDADVTAWMREHEWVKYKQQLEAKEIEFHLIRIAIFADFDSEVIMESVKNAVINIRFKSIPSQKYRLGDYSFDNMQHMNSLLVDIPMDTSNNDWFRSFRIKIPANTKFYIFFCPDELKGFTPPALPTNNSNKLKLN